MIVIYIYSFALLSILSVTFSGIMILRARAGGTTARGPTEPMSSRPTTGRTPAEATTSDPSRAATSRNIADATTGEPSSRPPDPNAGASTSTSTGSDSAEVQCNFCTSIRRQKNFKQCNGCGRYAHYTCAGLKKEEGDAIPIWTCKDCLDRENRGGEEDRPSSREGSAREVAPQDMARALAQLKSGRRLLKRIPRGTRILVASTLAERVEAVLSEENPLAWWRFLSFSFTALLAPDRDSKKTASSYIREQIANDSLAEPTQPRPEQAIPVRRTEPSENMTRRIASKCADGDIKAALRILTSDDTVIVPSAEVSHQLQQKHPAAPEDEDLPSHTDVDSGLAPTVDLDLMSKSLQAMSPGSSGGLDGIRPLHLQQLTSQGTLEAGHRLLTSLTRLINLIMQGKVPDYAREAIFGASLCALSKKDGGVRPIAVGSAYRRLAGRILAHQATSRLSPELSPIQLGVGVPRGCEAAVHAVREHITGLSATQDTSFVLVKVDIKNAFNSLRRDTLLRRVRQKCPELLPMVSHSYSVPTPLFFGDAVINSARGVQQGDPIGPLAFALAVDPIIRNVHSPLNVWYLDDGCLGGPAEEVAQDLSRLRTGFLEIGLELNPVKCEVAYLGPPQSLGRQAAIDTITRVMPEIAVVSPDELTLLGSPLHERGLCVAARRAADIVSLLCNRLKALDPHMAFFFLTHFVSVPRLTYLLRSCPIFKEGTILSDIDNTVQITLTQAINVDVSGDAWTQAALPTRMGGLGIRRVSDLARPCFLASLSSSAPLISRICPALGTVEEMDSWRLAREEFQQMTGVPSLPEGEAASSQKSWSDLAAESTKERLLGRANQVHRARLLAACSAHTAAWTQAVPVPSLGLHLDSETVRVAVSLRLGTPVSQPHRCRCGKQFDPLGHHGLACKYSSGRLARHANLNDVVKRALASAGMPSWLEPVGLNRGDGRRPDGITVFPFSGGRSLCWDATCVDTFCATNLPGCAMRSGKAAEEAERLKRERYAEISARFRFEPLAVETTGVLGPSSLKFVTELGSRARQCTGERRETQWLFQRISLAVARGNAAAVLASGRAVNGRPGPLQLFDRPA